MTTMDIVSGYISLGICLVWVSVQNLQHTIHLQIKNGIHAVVNEDD